MKIVKDKNGKEFTVDANVLAPEPNETDMYNFGGWVGTVTDILEDGTAIVEDGDSDFFAIEPERLEVVED